MLWYKDRKKSQRIIEAIAVAIGFVVATIAFVYIGNQFIEGQQCLKLLASPTKN